MICDGWRVGATVLLQRKHERQGAAEVPAGAARILVKAHTCAAPASQHAFHCAAVLQHLAQRCTKWRHVLPASGPSTCAIKALRYDAESCDAAEFSALLSSADIARIEC